MFGKLFVALDRLVERWLERRKENGSPEYRQLEIDWHTLRAGGVDADD